MIAELLSANVYAAGKYTGNIIMFPCSTSTCLQGVVALGPIAFLIVSPNLVVIYSRKLLSDSEVVYLQVGPVGHCHCESLTH